MCDKIVIARRIAVIAKALKTPKQSKQIATPLVIARFGIAESWQST